jgi:hypothetical protein
LNLDYLDKLTKIYEVDNKKLYEYLIEGDKLSVNKIINNQGFVALYAENFTLKNLKPDEYMDAITKRINELEKTVRSITETSKK